jgi:hypothetical protein
LLFESFSKPFSGVCQHVLLLFFITTTMLRHTAMLPAACYILLPGHRLLLIHVNFTIHYYQCWTILPYHTTYHHEGH